MNLRLCCVFFMLGSLVLADNIPDVAEPVDVPDGVQLVWRVEPGETIGYRLESEFFNVRGQGLRSDPVKSSSILLLSGREDSTIDLTWIQGKVRMPKDGFSMQQMQAFDVIAEQAGDVIFSARLSRSGTILDSEGLNAAQRLTQIIFGMPDEPRIAGDTWEFPVQLIRISGDEESKRIVDESSQVTLADMSQRRSKLVAQLEYMLSERVSYVAPKNPRRLSVAGEVDAVGEFRIDRGRWQHFEGSISNVMPRGQIEERFVLTPLRKVKKKWLQAVTQYHGDEV